MDRARLVGPDLGLGLEVRAAWAVPALVQALVHVPVVVDALHHLLHAHRVAGVGRADEEVVRDVDARHQLLETEGVAIGELLRRHPLALGGLRDGLAVLVGAREEEHVLAALAHMPGQDVRPDGRVRMAEVRRGVHVVDRGGDVERHRGRRRLAAGGRRHRRPAPASTSASPAHAGHGASDPAGVADARRGAIAVAAASAARRVAGCAWHSAGAGRGRAAARSRAAGRMVRWR